MLFRSALYCEKCAVPVARLRRETLMFAASFDKNESHSCSRCPAPISHFELDNARFTRWKEQLYCSLCSKDVKALLAPAQAAAAPQEEAVDICAHCSGLISASDVNSGLSLVVDGETICKQCRNDHTASVQKASVKKAALQTASVAKNDPTLAQGTRELTMQLLPDSGEMAALAAAPPSPSVAMATASVDLDFAPDASALEVLTSTADFESSSSASRSGSGASRSGSGASRSGSKKSRSDEKSKRPRSDERTHADTKRSKSDEAKRSRSDDSKRSDEKRKKTDPAKKSRKPEPEPMAVSADDLFGPPAAPADESPDVDLAALALEAEAAKAEVFEATCEVTLPKAEKAQVQEDGASPSRSNASKAKAKKTKGEVKIQVEEFSLDSNPAQPALGGDARGSQFDSQKATVPLDAPSPTKSQRRKKAAAEEESIAKLTGEALDSKRASSKRMPRKSGSGEKGAKCPICSRPADSKAAFADKAYCSACSVELAEVLAKTRMKSGADQACSVCEEPAHGEGALAFSLSNIAYCAGCAPQAEPIVESMVRDGMEKRRRRARKPLIAAAAVVLVAFVGGGFGLIQAAEPARSGAPAGMTKPAATEAEETEPVDGEGPAKALLDAFEADLGKIVANSGLSDSPLAFEASGQRDRAQDRLRVVTVTAHPDGNGKVRALMEYCINEKKLERRMVRWLDEKGGSFEKNSPVAQADNVILFKIEWTRGTNFVGPTTETASGAEFATRSPPKAIRVVLVTQGADGKLQRYEREVTLSK